MRLYMVRVQLPLVIPLLFISVVLFSQEKVKTGEYQPKLGQEGKDVRWFPTPQLLVDKMLDMAKIAPKDFLVDLGSGDGRTVITAAKRGVHAVGIEFNPDLIKLSKETAANAGVADKVEFIKADLFSYDFSKATVITMFLLPEINLRLRPRILNMKPGTRIVSTTFTMQNWQYDDMVKVEDKSSQWTSAYLWIVPAKVAGKWIFNGGQLELTQEFQMVSGELIQEDKSNEISDGRIRGSDITFKIGRDLYNGKIEGNVINGTALKDGKTITWKANKQQ